MSMLLVKQIAQMLLMVGMGFILVRTKLLKKEDSKVLSVLALYILAPCIIIQSFQIEYSPEIRDRLFLVFGAAILIHIVFLVVTGLLAKPLKLDVVERMSIIYSNAINMIIFLVTNILGPEWVVYASAYITVQTILQWTHCLSEFRGTRGISIKDLVSNVNLIAVFIGIIMLVAKVEFPSVIQGTMTAVGSMIGPVCMIVTGMLIGGMDLSRLLARKRAFLVVALRLIVLPPIMLVIYKLSGAARLVPDGETVLLISFLATSAPVAATLTQMAQVYGQDSEYASIINTISLLACIFTMPFLVGIFQG